MDSSVIVSLIGSGTFGLGGTWLGSRLSERSRKAALLEARQERAEEQQRAILTELTTVHLELLAHCRKIPDEVPSGKAPSDQWFAAEQAWGSQLTPLLDRASAAINKVQDPELRAHIQRVLVILRNWDWLDYAYHNRQRSWVLAALVTESMQWIGSAQRGDALPASGRGFQISDEALTLKEEEFEMAREEEQAERNRAAAPTEARGGSNQG